MQIVTDSGADIYLPPEQRDELDINVVPLVITLDGKSYREGVDIQPNEFYKLLAETESLPTTSQPSAGDFAETYRRLASTDPEILSIHMSSGLSGTFASAQAGAEMVPEANVTLVDTKTLSAASGWQVIAAAQAMKAGLMKEQILAMMKRISDACDSMFTLKELKYLIHGGRISHMKGLIASILNIKPIIGVEKTYGKYVQLGQARSFIGAIKGLTNLMIKQHTAGSAIRIQVLHSNNEDGAAILCEQVRQLFNCTLMPIGQLSLVLGAHTGPSMVGIAYAPISVFDDMHTAKT